MQSKLFAGVEPLFPHIHGRSVKWHISPGSCSILVLVWHYQNLRHVGEVPCRNTTQKVLEKCKMYLQSNSSLRAAAGGWGLPKVGRGILPLPRSWNQSKYLTSCSQYSPPPHFISRAADEFSALCSVSRQIFPFWLDDSQWGANFSALRFNHSKSVFHKNGHTVYVKKYYCIIYSLFTCVEEGVFTFSSLSPLLLKLFPCTEKIDNIRSATDSSSHS